MCASAVSDHCTTRPLGIAGLRPSTCAHEACLCIICGTLMMTKSVNREGLPMLNGLVRRPHPRPNHGDKTRAISLKNCVGLFLRSKSVDENENHLLKLAVRPNHRPGTDLKEDDGWVHCDDEVALELGLQKVDRLA